MSSKVKAKTPYRWINTDQGYISDGFATEDEAKMDLLESLSGDDEGNECHIVCVTQSYTASIGKPTLKPLKE